MPSRATTGAGPAWWLDGYIGKPAPCAERAYHERGNARHGVEFERPASLEELFASICDAITSDIANGLTPYGLDATSTRQAIARRAKQVAEGQLELQREGIDDDAI